MNLLPISALALSCVLIAAGCAPGVKTIRSRSFDPSSVNRIAVTALSGPNPRAGQAIADSIVPDLMEMGFTVVERAQLEKLTAEQSLHLTGAVDPATLQEVGRLAGVQAILLGDFAGHVEKTAVRRIARARPRLRRPGRAVIAGVREDYMIDSLSLRLVSVSTGEVLISSTRRNSFPASELDSAIDGLMKSMRKALESDKR